MTLAHKAFIARPENSVSVITGQLEKFTLMLRRRPLKHDLLDSAARVCRGPRLIKICGRNLRLAR